MNKLMRFFQKSRDWLESDESTSFLAHPATENATGPRAVVLAIDVSPSMEQDDYPPTRLEGAKRAVQRYLGVMLRREPETLIGVVDFHGEAELVTHPVPIGSHHRQLLESLTKLHTGSCTNIGAALQLAGRELARIRSPPIPRSFC